MKRNLFEMTFRVTETVQSGKEHTFKKHVYSERFIDGKFFTEEERIAQATTLLKEQHYYDIQYLGTRATALLMI